MKVDCYAGYRGEETPRRFEIEPGGPRRDALVAGGQLVEQRQPPRPRERAEERAVEDQNRHPQSRSNSRIEERFARDFARLARDWAIVREPEPIDAGGHLFFPDFAVHPRLDPSRRWFVEIVGFWTAEYLAAKLERLRRARVSNLVLCIDEDRDVGDGDLPASAALVRYGRRVDAAKVLEIVAATEPAT